MIIAGTGHRPQDCEAEEVVRTKVRAALRYSGADCIITGMAAGFDLWFADEARLLDIEIWAAKPWRGHQSRQGDEELHETIIEAASQVVNVTPFDEFPGPSCYHARNQWMVDNATHVLAYLNPQATSGGTFQCCKYARGKKPIRNIYTVAPF